MTRDVVDANGVPAAANSDWEPPKGSSPYFGWRDVAGDPNSVRYDAIVGLFRNAQSGRFMILIQNAPLTPQISDRDAERLLKRMGWTKGEESYGDITRR